MFGPGDYPAGWGGPASAGAYLYTPATDTFEALGIPFTATLHLDAASQTNGAEVSGTFSLSTLRLPF
jgi:hypothetical protein